MVRNRASRGGNIYVVTFAINLVWLRHLRVKRVERQLHHAGMRHPCSVVAVARFAFLVGAHFRKSLFVRRRIFFTGI